MNRAAMARRRIASPCALRVRLERYRIGQGDHVDSAATKILFVTVGYFLHHLAHRYFGLVYSPPHVSRLVVGLPDRSV